MRRLSQSGMNKGQVQSEQQSIKACIVWVEGDHKGAGETGAPHRLGWSHLRLWQPSVSRIHVQEVLLPEAQALLEASRQNSEDVLVRNDARHQLQLLRFHACITRMLHSISYTASINLTGATIVHGRQEFFAPLISITLGVNELSCNYSCAVHKSMYAPIPDPSPLWGGSHDA